jgi:hypothetical protein
MSLVAVILVVVLAGCTPATQALARLGSDGSIEVVFCSSYDSDFIEFDFYDWDDPDGVSEWRATSPESEEVGLQILSFGDPPAGWSTESESGLPDDWDSLYVDIEPSPRSGRPS